MEDKRDNKTKKRESHRVTWRRLRKDTGKAEKKALLRSTRAPVIHTYIGTYIHTYLHTYTRVERRRKESGVGACFPRRDERERPRRKRDLKVNARNKKAGKSVLSGGCQRACGSAEGRER